MNIIQDSLCTMIFSVGMYVWAFFQIMQTHKFAVMNTFNPQRTEPVYSTATINFVTFLYLNLAYLFYH